DVDDRLLMLRIHDPSATRGPNPITADFWLLVGGGVQPGETYEQAAYREVVEETGLREVTIGRCVWTQEKLVADPAAQRQRGPGCSGGAGWGRGPGWASPARGRWRPPRSSATAGSPTRRSSREKPPKPSCRPAWAGCSAPYSAGPRPIRSR